MKKLILTLFLSVALFSCSKTTHNPVILAFEDPIFEAYLVANFDKDGDGVICQAEGCEVEILDMWNMGITSLRGIEKLTFLKVIMCDDNLLTEIDVTKLCYLEQLWCGGMPITEIDVAKNYNLRILACGGTLVETLDLQYNTELRELKCRDTKLKTLDLSKNTSMLTLWCDGNALLRDVYFPAGWARGAMDIEKDDHTTIRYK